jgi:hypothetical protein
LADSSGTLKVNEARIFRFAVRDGLGAPRTGLASGEFLATLYDPASGSSVLTVTETGSGLYQVSITATSTGPWSLVVTLVNTPRDTEAYDFLASDNDIDDATLGAESVGFRVHRT